MALPEKVIEQLGRETPKTPGWSFGIISFSAGIFFIVIFLWVGLTAGYKPYLDAQTAKIEDQINQENQLVSPADQTALINYYSQISNLQVLLQNHVDTANFFTWLEQNTESNVYYSSLSLTSGNQVSLTAEATTEADANQQIAIFESSPEVQSVSVSGISEPSGSSFWQFNVTLVLEPSVFTNTTTQP